MSDAVDEIEVNPSWILNLFVEQRGTVDMVFTERECTDYMIAMAKDMVKLEEIYEAARQLFRYQGVDDARFKEAGISLENAVDDYK